MRLDPPVRWNSENLVLLGSLSEFGNLDEPTGSEVTRSVVRDEKVKDRADNMLRPCSFWAAGPDGSSSRKGRADALY